SHSTPASPARRKWSSSRCRSSRIADRRLWFALITATRGRERCTSLLVSSARARQVVAANGRMAASVEVAPFFYQLKLDTPNVADGWRFKGFDLKPLLDAVSKASRYHL